MAKPSGNAIVVGGGEGSDGAARRTHLGGLTSAGWGGALLLIAGVTLARVVYVQWFCPYALVEDEAYYWLWSRHLDWSYLTKGPGVALTIALGTLVGGDTEAGVRLTAPLWGAVLAVGVAGAAGELVARLGRDGRAEGAGRGEAIARARVWGAGLALLSPALQATSLLMTIDGPMLACWAVATWAAVRAARGSVRAWVWGGAAVGVGLLFKPTIAIVMIGFVVAALCARGSREGAMAAKVSEQDERPARRGVWIGLGLVLAMLGLAPIVVWNAQHDWALVRHLMEHLRAEGGATPSDGVPLGRRLGWIGEYVGLQALLGGAGLVVGVLGMVWAWRSARRAARQGARRDAGRVGRRELVADGGGSRAPLAEARVAAARSAEAPLVDSLAVEGGPSGLDPRGVLVCAAMSVPVYLLYLVVAASTRVEGNWALGGLIGALAIGGATVASATTTAAVASARREWARGLARAAVVVGLVTGLGELRLDLVAALPGIGGRVPLGRLTSAPRVGEGVEALAARLDREAAGSELEPELGSGSELESESESRAAGQTREAMTDADARPAFVITDHYGLSSLMAFYARDRWVGCASRRLSGKVTQFDLWAETSLERPDLLGRNAVILSGRIEQWTPAFERVEAVEPIAGDHRRRRVYLGYGYLGWSRHIPESDEPTAARGATGVP